MVFEGPFQSIPSHPILSHFIPSYSENSTLKVTYFLVAANRLSSINSVGISLEEANACP